MIIIDTETTGLQGGSRLVEIAAIDMGAEGGDFHTLVNPGMPIPKDASDIHGITDDMVADAPDALEALQRLKAWADVKSGGHVSFTAHNAKYDTGIIAWDAARHGMPDLFASFTVRCTCELAKALGATKNNALETIAEHYGLERKGDAHRAMSDADLVWQYIERMNVEFAAGNLRPPLFPEWISESVVFFHDAGHRYRYFQPEGGLARLPGFVTDGESIRFQYEDAKGAITERRMTPYGWCAVGEHRYIHGWDHVREARREFRVDRILGEISV